MARQTDELFATAARGYDKEQVQRHLREMVENHVMQQEELQELADSCERNAQRAREEAVSLRRELGEALYDLQAMNKEMDRLRREKEDAEKKAALADKLLANMRAEVTAANSLKEEMEHSLRQSLEQNCRLEKQLAERPAQELDPSLQRQNERLRAELLILRGRNEELEAQIAGIRRKVIEAAKLRQARQNKPE